MQNFPENKHPLSVAVLFFTRTAGEEASAKQFVTGTGSRINLKIAHQVIQHAERLLHSLPVPVITKTSRFQTGDTFAKRFVAACEEVFDMGYDNIIAVGNDCLSLTRSLLASSVRFLYSGYNVIGPATDGGAYLIGMNRASFSSKRLLDLPWQTDRLSEYLHRFLSDNGAKPVTLLPVLSDIDHESDFRSMVNELLSRHIYPELAQLLQFFLNILHIYPADQCRLPLSLSHKETRCLRAPPFAA